jgi:hypothetical protein
MQTAEEARAGLCQVRVGPNGYDCAILEPDGTMMRNVVSATVDIQCDGMTIVELVRRERDADGRFVERREIRTVVKASA